MRDKPKTLSKLFYLLIFIITSNLLLMGCARHIGVYIQAANDLNNGGNPVVVRIYQLTTDVNFKSETSETFWKNRQLSFERDARGEPKEIMLHPREVVKIEKLVIDDETIYLGVAADFYEPDKDQWYYISDISKNNCDQVLIAVRKNTLVMTCVDD